MSQLPEEALRYPSSTISLIRWTILGSIWSLHLYQRQARTRSVKPEPGSMWKCSGLSLFYSYYLRCYKN